MCIAVTANLREDRCLVEKHLLLRGLTKHVPRNVLVSHEDAEFTVDRGPVFLAGVVLETKERAPKGDLCHGIVGDPVYREGGGENPVISH